MTQLSPAEEAAYAALRTRAVCFESPGRWSAFRGDKAAVALNGLVTNDVAVLEIGGCLYAAALTPKGKMVADMMIVRSDSTTFLIHVLPPAASDWLALARKYVNPRLCQVADEADRYRSWFVVGVHAAAVLNASTLRIPMQVYPAPPLGDLPAFLLVAESASAADAGHELAAAGVIAGSSGVWEIARMEAGRPEMGREMDENTIPQEANLDALDAISFSKGCYTGQETVARVHFRGHVNKHLRGLLSDAPLNRGAEVSDSAGKLVGDVRSAVTSPRLASIALAMIRREVASGSAVSVASAHGPISARVIDLPFK